MHIYRLSSLDETCIKEINYFCFSVCHHLSVVCIFFQYTLLGNRGFHNHIFTFTNNNKRIWCLALGLSEWIILRKVTQDSEFPQLHKWSHFKIISQRMVYLKKNSQMVVFKVLLVFFKVWWFDHSTYIYSSAVLHFLLSFPSFHPSACGLFLSLSPSVSLFPMNTHTQENEKLLVIVSWFNSWKSRVLRLILSNLCLVS